MSLDLVEGVNFVSLIGHNSGSWIWGDELRMFSCSLIMIDCPWRFETWSDAGKVEKAAEAPAPAGPSEVDLLTEIRDALKKA